MIEQLEKGKNIISKKHIADLHYIRINGNLILHPSVENIQHNTHEIEVIIMVIVNLVEWYILSYVPRQFTGQSPVVETDHSLPDNPYRGLEAFREQDSAQFFGRTEDSQSLYDKLQTQCLVAVVGVSGSGKSSLVYAGLLPKLRKQGWQIIAFRPGQNPFERLAQAFVELLYIDKLDRLDRLEKARQLHKQLQNGLSLTALADLLADKIPKQGLVMVIDQFEELYTHNPQSAAAFIDFLLAWLAFDARYRLLLTIRADFFGHLTEHPQLTASLNRNQPKLLGLISQSDSLKTIIEQPAKNAGVCFESLLIERILRDLSQTQNQEGISLPLLEFTLAELWNKQSEPTLRHEDYDQLGGVQLALPRHAEQVFQKYSAKQQQRVRHILIQLVHPGLGTEDTRQVATRDQLNQDWPLISRLADERLVVTGHDDSLNQDTVEVVHEALIRHWQRLREWMQEDRVFRIWQDNLRIAIGEWRQNNQDHDALLCGARLALAEEKIKSESDRLADFEQEYIRLSLEQREQEQQREQALKEREQQRELELAEQRTQLAQQRGKQARRLIQLMGLGFVMVLALLVWVWFERNHAEAQALRAEKSEAHAKQSEQDSKNQLFQSQLT
ncbi:MAG: ATP-binding protein, partial [Blastocatellia bacterium]